MYFLLCIDLSPSLMRDYFSDEFILSVLMSLRKSAGLVDLPIKIGNYVFN